MIFSSQVHHKFTQSIGSGQRSTFNSGYTWVEGYLVGGGAVKSKIITEATLREPVEVLEPQLLTEQLGVDSPALASPAWTYPGSIGNHLASGHGVDASGLSQSEAVDLHNRLHNAERYPSMVSYQDDCPDGMCPTGPSRVSSGVGSSCPGGNCPQVATTTRRRWFR
jgi:hypothetical protein